MSFREHDAGQHDVTFSRAEELKVHMLLKSLVCIPREDEGTGAP